MDPETDSTGGIRWKTEGDRVLVSFPPGHEVFPQGKTVVFSALTPTDLVEVQGVRSFPNQDGVTAESVNQLAQAPETLRKLVDAFESAAHVINDAEKLKERCLALVRSMAPDYPSSISLSAICLGMQRTIGNVIVPNEETVRSMAFAFGGLEFSDMHGRRQTYSMALDDKGKFNYSPQGILYKRIN